MGGDIFIINERNLQAMNFENEYRRLHTTSTKEVEQLWQAQNGQTTSERS